MSRCTHNDTSPELQPCKNEGIGEHGYCVEHGCCLCGGVMLADTEDWRVYLCDTCWSNLNGDYTSDVHGTFKDLQKLIEAAYQAGRRSVIGDTSGVDDG